MPDDLITVRPTLLVRVMRAVGLLPSGELEFEAGADYSPHHPAEPQYPKRSSMSAFAAFPWVYACVDAIAADLSGLPLKAIRGTGDKAETLDDHPVLELLSNPSSRISPTLFRRQIVTDYVLTGDAYALIAGETEPQALLRLAPQRVRVIPWTDGQPGSYEYNGAGGRANYDYNEILHLRSPSWEDDPSSLYGTGAIRPLDADLRTEQAAVNSAASTAKIGRPSGIISPTDDGDRWSAEQISRMRGAYEKQLGGKSGVLFLGGSANFQQLAWSPRDLEFVEQRRMTRESVLAVFSVPPTRVGLPSANYATAREQSRMYWTSLLAKAAMIDAEFTRLASLFPNSEGIRVVHDFAAVEALQESRTERVQRVNSWWNSGMKLQDAATVEASRRSQKLSRSSQSRRKRKSRQCGRFSASRRADERSLSLHLHSRATLILTSRRMNTRCRIVVRSGSPFGAPTYRGFMVRQSGSFRLACFASSRLRSAGTSSGCERSDGRA